MSTISRFHSIARIFGVYPRDDSNKSKYWMIYSISLHGFFSGVHVINFFTQYNQAGAYKKSFLVFLTGVANSSVVWIHLIRIKFGYDYWNEYYIAFTESVMKPISLDFLPAMDFFLTLILTVISVIYKEVPLEAAGELIGTHGVNLIVFHYIRVMQLKSTEMKEIVKYAEKYPQAANTHTIRIANQVERIHQVLSPQITAYLIYITGVTVHIIYMAIDSNNTVILDTIVAIAWVLLLMSRVLLMLWSSSAIEIQLKAFYAELFRVVWSRDDLCANKKMVLILTNQRRVKLTACGLFTLGYPVFTSIITVATTYLVILLQFN